MSKKLNEHLIREHNMQVSRIKSNAQRQASFRARGNSREVRGLYLNDEDAYTLMVLAKTLRSYHYED